MYYLKGCPKFHGDVYKSTDIYGPYTSCMQCSHYLTEVEEVQLNQPSLNRPMQLSAVVREESVAA